MTSSTPTLGNIHLLRQSAVTLCTLPCQTDKSCALNCVLLDEKGRSIWEQTIEQQATDSTIELRLPKLKPGDYNCWIEIDGQMHIRKLKVAPKKHRNLLGKWVSLFA